MSFEPLPVFYIGKSLTSERITNYENNKHNLLSAAISKPDTKSVWYSKEHIEKLLKEIEIAGGDGMRICLGMYESTHEFAGQLCLLMIPTRELSVNHVVSHQNVYLEEEPNFVERSALPRTIPIEGDPLFGKKEFNYGSPCPPRCD